MKFTTEHRFPAAPSRVAALMLDPDFEANVQLPDLSSPTVLEHGVDTPAHRLRLRYEYIGDLDPLARRLLAGRTLALVQTVEMDPETDRGTLTIEAEADPGRLHGNGSIEIVPDGDAANTSVRRLAGEFVVKVPLIGGGVERKLLPGILSRFDVEAAALAARLQEAE